MSMLGKRDPEMQEFWSSLSPKLKPLLYQEGRRLIFSSDEVPLQMVNISRYRAAPKFYLFTDVFAIIQSATVTEHYLEEVWIEHIVPAEGLMHSLQNMTSFRLVFPESTLELQCKELAHKSKWVSRIAEAIGVALNLPQFISGRGDISLDTQLELLRGRDYLEYTFRTMAKFKGGKYKGPWRNAKPHGIGEFCQETTGQLYKGGFKEGLFHGEGEMHWFSDKDKRKKYIGEFRNGELEGQGEMKYSNGDVYSGRWVCSQRSGFGQFEETSRKGSSYSGAWERDKRNGYGVYQDKMRHERYLGMWSDDVRLGPGMIVTSTGTYCEATFSHGTIAPGYDGFVIDPSGRSFMGKLGPDLKLCGKGVLTLTNNTVIEGSFGGHWHKKLEIHRAVLEDGQAQEERVDTPEARMAELQIAKLDKRIGNCTVLACNKWQPIFSECETALGFRGDASSDVISAWSTLAAESFRRKSDQFSGSPRVGPRANSLTGLYGRTVKIPVDLIPLERARALTAGCIFRDDSFISNSRSESFSGMSKALSVSSELLSRPTNTVAVAEDNFEYKLRISRPLNLDESVSFCSSYPMGTAYRASLPPYAPQADASPSPELRPSSDPLPAEGLDVSDFEKTLRESPDAKTAIQKYIDKSFNTPSHPLGILMNRLEAVYHESYGGMGASRFLLPHAIPETHSLIQRIHSIVRILFPFLSGNDQNVSWLGLKKAEESTDPDDYLSIESGYGLIHPLVFMRLFPTLITLYVLHHDEGDRNYKNGMDFFKEMDDDRLVQFIRFPGQICRKIVGKEADGDLLKALDEASNTLRVVNSFFTPGEFLVHFKNAFKRLNSIEQLSGDFLLPAVVFILVRSNVPHLGAYLHFLTDFAHTQPEDEYTLVTYEAAYNFIKTNAPGSS